MLVVTLLHGNEVLFNSVCMADVILFLSSVCSLKESLNSLFLKKSRADYVFKKLVFSLWFPVRGFELFVFLRKSDNEPLTLVNLDANLTDVS